MVNRVPLNANQREKLINNLISAIGSAIFVTVTGYAILLERGQQLYADLFLIPGIILIIVGTIHLISIARKDKPDSKDTTL